MLLIAGVVGGAGLTLWAIAKLHSPQPRYDTTNGFFREIIRRYRSRP